ncbi:MAG: hypothetical protein JW943_14865 [Deltaproteobacteria bacterium]|nr:hypothetical protein [Deltaproteobacteria bacterium]
MSVDQVKTFFNKATIMSQHELNYEYNILSCYVRGILIDSKGEHAWEIRAGGTGRINYHNDNEVLLGCEECADGFQ